MEALRILRKPLNNKIQIDLPDNFTEDEVEIIIMPVDKKTSSDKKFDPGSFRGFMKEIKMDIDKEIRQMRDEWNKDF